MSSRVNSNLPLIDTSSAVPHSDHHAHTGSASACAQVRCRAFQDRFQLCPNTLASRLSADVPKPIPPPTLPGSSQAQTPRVGLGRDRDRGAWDKAEYRALPSWPRTRIEIDDTRTLNNAPGSHRSYPVDLVHPPVQFDLVVQQRCPGCARIGAVCSGRLREEQVTDRHVDGASEPLPPAFRVGRCLAALPLR